MHNACLTICVSKRQQKNGELLHTQASLSLTLLSYVASGAGGFSSQLNLISEEHQSTIYWYHFSLSFPQSVCAAHTHTPLGKLVHGHNTSYFHVASLVLNGDTGDTHTEYILVKVTSISSSKGSRCLGRQTNPCYWFYRMTLTSVSQTYRKTAGQNYRKSSH